MKINKTKVLFKNITTYNNKNILTTLLFILLLISFVLLRFYLPLRRLKKTKENIRKSSTSIHTFFFYDYYLKVDKQIIYYFKLYKIFETKDYFYLYINQDYALMLDKKGFQIGTVENFRSFIKKKCLLKYKEIS